MPKFSPLERQSCLQPVSRTWSHLPTSVSLEELFGNTADFCTQIDFEKVAEELQYKNVAVARANFNRAWKKHFKHVDASAIPPPAAGTKAKVTKRKAPNGEGPDATKRKRLSKITMSPPSNDEDNNETKIKEEKDKHTEEDESDGINDVKTPELTPPKSDVAEDEQS